MTTTNTTAILHEALDASADNAQQWNAGDDAFDEAIADGASTEDAYIAALEHASSDDEAFEKGGTVLVNHKVLSKHLLDERLVAIREAGEKTPTHRGAYIKNILGFGAFGLFAGMLLGTLFAWPLRNVFHDDLSANTFFVITTVTGLLVGVGIGVFRASVPLRPKANKETVTPVPKNDAPISGVSTTHHA